MAKVEQRSERISAWINDARALLGLSTWRIVISLDAAESDAWADIEPNHHADSATLRLANDFWKQPPDKQREILAHELLHLVVCRQDQLVENLEDALGKVAWSVFEPQYDDATERTVDNLARIIAPMLPPIR